MKHPLTPPIVHKLEQRAKAMPERVNEFYRSRHPANRTGWLDLAIGAVILAVLLTSFWMLGGVR